LRLATTGGLRKIRKKSVEWDYGHETGCPGGVEGAYGGGFN